MSLSDIMQVPQSKTEAALLAAGALIPAARVLKGARGAINAGTRMLEGAAPETGLLSRAINAAEAPGTSIARNYPQQAAGFKTSQGSTYVLNGESTTRTKTPHMGHDPADIGEKSPSTRTVYVDPAFATEVGMWNTLSATGKRIVPQGDKITLVSVNPAAGKLGRDPLIHDNTFTTTPAVGRAPLELFKPDESGHYRGNHPGNPIIRLENPQIYR
jgi:hypothetical protein